MNKSLNRAINWKLWAGLIISAVFLYLAFRKVDLSRTWEVIRSADVFLLSIVVVITFLQYVIRTWRWRILLEPIKRTGFSNRLSSILIGFSANNIFPARLGEFIRANYLGNTEKMSRSSAFGTIVVERFFDGFTLLLVLLIGLMGTTFPKEFQSVSGSLRATGMIVFLIYILVIVFLMGFKYKTSLFLNLLDRILFFLPRNLRSRIIDVAGNFSRGLVLTRDPFGWIQVVFYSFLLWFTSIYQIQLVEQSIGLDIPFIAAFLILAMGSFGVMIPSAPGFIGTFHLAATYGFLLYGISKEEALSAAILWHAVFFFPTILFGFVSFLFLHSSLNNLSIDPHIRETE